MKHFDVSVIIILDPIPSISREKIDLVDNRNNVISSYNVFFFVFFCKYTLKIESTFAT